MVVLIVYMWNLIYVYVVLFEKSNMNVVVFLIIMKIMNVLIEIGDEDNGFEV